MPTFTYQARDERGRLVKGVLEADSTVALADRLRKMGYLVTRIDRAQQGWEGLIRFSFFRKVSQEQLLLSVIQLANLAEAGVPLISSLEALAADNALPSLREALEKARKEIEGGTTFSEAMSHSPEIFPKLLVSLTTVGEATGKLDTVLNRFAGFLEREIALKREVQGALLYPAVLLAAAAALVLFVVSFVVPQFSILYLKTGIPLPWPTRILQGVGEAIRTQGWLLIAGGVAVVGGWTFLERLPRVRSQRDRILLKLPVLGEVIHQTLVARFARTFATLVGSGVPILSALETVEGVVGNDVLLQEIRRLRSSVERGERLAAVLSVGKVFHPDAIQMIRVGEESGALDQMLERVADLYEKRVNFSLKQMTTLLEPALLVVMGGVVGFIMASLLLPMFNMVKVLQTGGVR
ncbi:MAG: type II secretion system F family protein [Candidatus Omnitrophica bacterium]|nr:type II secretion system F family protein [Candidatus Omnitrophota bacterium]